MAKRQPNFVCQSCGAVYNRWKGKCEACGGWNSIVEETGSANPMVGPVATRPARAKGRIFPLEGLTGEAKDAPRTPCGIAELDRVTGGGFVRGSVILLGGDPGHRQVDPPDAGLGGPCARAARVAYISGEEAVAQVRLRAERLGLAALPWSSPPRPTWRTSSPPCRRAARRRSPSSTRSRPCGPRPVESAPGTVTQVRGSAQALIRFAKTTGTAGDPGGHVTKDGQIAGPGGRAHGGRGGVLRGRYGPPFPHHARR
jgi:DNA repair protein RadA/Sms